jgi:hypothetical protein
MTCYLSRRYQWAYNALYGEPKTVCFNRERLPNPEAYYREHLPDLKPSGKGWASARCPFHSDDHPSLRVNLENGGFVCRGCSTKGGDVLDFERRLTGVSFMIAAQRLGCWIEP